MCCTIVRYKKSGNVTLIDKCESNQDFNVLLSRSSNKLNAVVKSSDPISEEECDSNGRLLWQKTSGVNRLKTSEDFYESVDLKIGNLPKATSKTESFQGLYASVNKPTTKESTIQFYPQELYAAVDKLKSGKSNSAEISDQFQELYAMVNKNN